MRCPRCGVDLIPGRMGSLVAHGCERCAGLWLDNVQSKRVVDGLSADSLAAVRAHSGSSLKAINTEAAHLSCPTCHRELERKRVAAAWLDVDICLDHGTWFDRGEVERIADAMNKPLPSDWRTKTAESGPKPQPMKRHTVDALEQPDHRSPYLRGFGQILRALGDTLSEGDLTIEVGGVEIDVDGDDW